MGYPAVGMEGLYRNRREDAQKFLDHRYTIALVLERRSDVNIAVQA